MNLRRQIPYQLGRLTERLPYPLHAALWRALQLAKPLPLARLAGVTRAGAPGTMLVAGVANEAEFLAEYFFAAGHARTELGAIRPWALARRLGGERGRDDLTAVRLDRVASRCFPREEFLRVPEWICTSFPTPRNVEELAVGNHSLRHDLNRISREGFGVEEARAAAEFGEFFDGMLVPYLAARYGLGLLSRAKARHFFDRGALLWVMGGGARVGGVIVEHVEHGDRRLIVRYFGVAGGDEALMKKGVLAAAYVAAVDYARRHGCPTVDLGGARPALSDGILRYKRKWGARPDPRTNNEMDFYLRWPAGNAAVAALLAAHPLIARTGDEFAVVGPAAAWPPVLAPIRDGRWPG